MVTVKVGAADDAERDEFGGGRFEDFFEFCGVSAISSQILQDRVGVAILATARQKHLAPYHLIQRIISA